MIRPFSKSSRDAGFSLVESLASLVVVGMLALMVASGVTTGRRVWERVDARQAGQEALETAQNLLRDRLERTYPKVSRDAFAKSTDFTGTRGELAFLAEPEDAARPGAVRRYRLEVTATGELVLSSSQELGGASAAPAVRRVLLTGVRGVEFGYFGAAPPDGERIWRDAWSEQPVPPDLVRIRLAFEPGDRRVWPDLVVRPLATIDTGCRLDTTYHRCRGRG